ncbi:MAG: molybdopterin cofactor-binding domain-containing protein [Burkholderiaceae bacterium]
MTDTGHQAPATRRGSTPATDADLGAYVPAADAPSGTRTETPAGIHSPAGRYYQAPAHEHRALFDARGVLLVTRPAPPPPPPPAERQLGVLSRYQQPYPDILVAVRSDGTVLAFNGHVDLGTGVRTALGQLVADELDVSFDRVRVELGHTSATPDQGPTVASATLQISALPLRRAAATARLHLRQLAARHLSARDEDLSAADGVLRHADGRSLTYAELIGEQTLQLSVRDDVALKPAAEHRWIGRSVPRVELAAKAAGAPIYVHDVRVPGMWHARVVRPPYAGRDCGEFIGKSLRQVDRSALADLPQPVEVIVIGDFVAVAAPREETAIAASRRLRVEWARVPPLPAVDDIDALLRGLPHRERVLVDERTDDSTAAAATVRRSFRWPYQLHGSIGPSCAVADYAEAGSRIWSGTQNPHWLRADLSRLIEQDEGLVEIIRLEAAGCYGRNCADDVSADALLVSRQIGRPVRVQLSREDEHAWEPKGAAQLIDVQASIGSDGALLDYRFCVRYPANDAPNLGLLLTGRMAAAPRMLEIGDRTAVPPYRYRNRRVLCHDVAPVVRASWLRGVSAMPNSLAHDAVMDELAALAGVDPLAFRLHHLDDERAKALLEATAARAGWRAGSRGSRGEPGADGRLRGRGISYARYTHSKFPGFPAAWSAWVLDLSIDPDSGRINIERVVVGQDSGMMVNPAGIRHQIHGNVIQSLSRVLHEASSFDANGSADREWGSYPMLRFRDIPPIELVLIERQDEPPLGAGESSSVPAPAAVANALFDATGQRFEEVPFTPERVRQALASRLAAGAA